MPRKGLPKSIIKKYGITKKAWSVFRGGKSKSRPSKVKTKTRRETRMTRRKRRRGKRGFTIPLAPIAGLAAGLWGPAEAVMKGDLDTAVHHLLLTYTGYDNKASVWRPEHLQRGLTPLIIGCLVHKFVGGSPLNLNRTLAAAGVPFIRI